MLMDLSIAILFSEVAVTTKLLQLYAATSYYFSLLTNQQ